jgi:hypothetical protein
MASTYLSRTTWGTPTDAKKFTLSFWVKRGTLGARNTLVGSYDNSSAASLMFSFEANDTLYIALGGSSDYDLQTTQLFRDVSAWYHIVYAVDSTQATASNRQKLYINGSQITAFNYINYTTLNSTTLLFNNSYRNNIGSQWQISGYFDGSMTHTHFIDGLAYDASTFGETDTATGIWKPKTAPVVTYGTNGFFLKFENSASFGTDSSPNANNFTVNGTMTQTIDTPSNVFATFNPLNVPTSNAPTFSEGNLQVTTTNLSHVGGFSTIGITTGKWYAEFKIISTSSENATIGITGQSAENARNNKFAGQETTSYGYSYTAWGSLYDGSGTGSWGSTYGAGDIIGVAVDLDSNNLYFYKNGVVQNGGTAVSITASSSTSEGVYCFGTGDGSIGNNNTVSANFGNGYFGTTPVSSAENPDDGIGIFEYTVPTGYKALCTKSINAQEYS